MPLRITTWNVNGIRNPFSYKPWSENRSFAAMFDTLQADIVCFQETKIQRKDLRDDMVLIPGWDCYYTFPVHKRGYSGVAVFTRQGKVTPIRVEEGITGILCPPKSTQCYLDMPEDETIGGYPDVNREDAKVLDSEGRALIVDLGAFVLIGTYSPANRDESRDEFREMFVEVLFERVRNLIKEKGRRVVLVGDLNIARDAIDMAGGEPGHSTATKARRLFNVLCEPHEAGVMVDIVREFWPERKGMYTHWEQKINARPGNYGSRIDYVLCSSTMRSWFSEANIQEGLMGSDHCPVYGVIKDVVEIDGKLQHILDLVNPQGYYEEGVRKIEELPAPAKHSARLYAEFAGRRKLTELFAKKPKDSAATASTSKSNASASSQNVQLPTPAPSQTQPSLKQPPSSTPPSTHPASPTMAPPAKRQKTIPSASEPISKPARKQSVGNQRQLTAFFKAKPTPNVPPNSEQTPNDTPPSTQTTSQTSSPSPSPRKSNRNSPTPTPPFPVSPLKPPCNTETSKAVWSSLFTRPPAPKCDGHGEEARQMVVRKAGPNCGRAFWMCARPVGPEGEGKDFKEMKGVDPGEWRCGFFQWVNEGREKGGEKEKEEGKGWAKGKKMGP